MTNPVKRALLALGIGAVAFVASGCAGGGCGLAQSRTNACIFENSMNPGKAISSDAKPLKTGKACGFNVMRIVALGDMRVSTAAQSAGITKIASVDSEVFNLITTPGWLAIYGRYCTVVKGE